MGQTQAFPKEILTLLLNVAHLELVFDHFWPTTCTPTGNGQWFGASLPSPMKPKTRCVPLPTVVNHSAERRMAV